MQHPIVLIPDTIEKIKKILRSDYTFFQLVQYIVSFFDNINISDYQYDYQFDVYYLHIKIMGRPSRCNLYLGETGKGAT